jgi:uncharacterized protein with beta-barrel porin domain
MRKATRRATPGGTKVAIVSGRPGGLTPYAAIQAQSFHTPGYTETGLIPNGFALTFNGGDATDTRSEWGTRFDRVLAVYSDAVLARAPRLGARLGE